MKGRFVALALVVSVCAAGIGQAQVATVSVRDIDFIEPSSRLADFVVAQAMQGVRFSSAETAARSASSENKSTVKRHRLGSLLAESCMILLGGIATGVVYTEFEDKPPETVAMTADSVAGYFDFLGDLVSGGNSEAQFLKAVDNCNKNIVLTEAGGQ